MKLSVAMIVKNEEAMLARCLESVKGVDEIVICDTGSDDRTVEIAKQYTDKVFTDFTWNDSFADARNHAKSKVTGDWVLSIDADEVLTDGSLRVIREAIETANGANTLSTKVAYIKNEADFFHFPRVYKNVPEVFWRGAAHNHLSVQDGPEIEATILYDSSPAHALDPDRTLRILQRAVNESSDLVREFYYLGREYFYKKNYAMAEHYLTIYVKEKAYWAAEWAEGWLLLGQVQKLQGRYKDARDSVLQAVSINTNFKEAILFLADLSGPINKARWMAFADGADNSGVMFTRTVAEKGSDYYDELFAHSADMSRYKAIHQEIQKMVKGKALDMGCGTGELQHYIKRYSGFDFSEVAVATANHPNVWKGDLYTEQLGDYDTYITTEVLEHVDDLRVLQRIPKGRRVVFSVPSFNDPSHLRVYTERYMRDRFKRLLDIHKVIRFNWANDKWTKGGENTGSYILLVEARRKSNEN